MNAGTLLTNEFGPFLSIHNFIDQQKIPPSAKRLWGAIYGFYREYGSVYLCRAFFANKLGVRKETISRALKALEKIGAINRTGELKFGFYPCVELLAPKDTNSQPVTKRSLSGDRLVTEQRPFDHPQKNKKREHIKEQTVVDLSKKEFSSNEKIALKQKLKAIGVHKQVIDRLIGKYSIEKINTQIEHLQQVLDRGGSIEKPAAWLISAIERNYTLPKEQSKNTLENEKEADAVRRATVMAQAAKSELIAGNLREALELSTQSALIAENGLAKEVHNETQHLLERAQEIEKARQLVSAETLALIRHEEEQKKLKEMQRWGKSEAQILASNFFKGAVEALVNQRLLGAV